MISAMRLWIGSSIANYLNDRGEQLLKANDELWTDLCDYRENSASTGCSYSDLATLYKEVRRRRPKNVLELGTGVSTIVIAHALKSIGEGLVTSMEESEEYYQMAKRLVPKHLEKYIDLHWSPAVEKTRDFLRGAGYKDIPRRPYDFVFVDGPSYLSNPNAEHLAFNYDLIEVLEHAERPVFALIDSRHSTCYVYHLLLGNRVRYDYIRKLGVVLPSTKKDLRSPKEVVSAMIREHVLRRPPLF